jgi:hypothetical protein
MMMMIGPCYAVAATAVISSFYRSKRTSVITKGNSIAKKEK